MSDAIRFGQRTEFARSQGSLPDDVVNQVCDSIRDELGKTGMSTYINSILTAHVMKRPSDHEAGLAQLLQLRG